MTFMIKAFYILLLTFIGACAIYLMYGEIPAPTSRIERVLPNEYFFGKKKEHESATAQTPSSESGTPAQ